MTVLFRLNDLSPDREKEEVEVVDCFKVEGLALDWFTVVVDVEGFVTAGGLLMASSR